MPTSILWLRRDLRVHDNPALHAARANADRLVPAFVLDDRLLHGRHASGARTQFLLECLKDLDAALQKRGTRLVVRQGPPERELVELAEETGATELHFSADVTPFARRRDRVVAAALADAGVALHAHPGLYVADAPGDIRTKAGKPQTVFGHYHRAWLATPRRDPLPAPRKLPPLPSRLAKGRVPTLAALGLESEVEQPARGGEHAGRRRMRAYLAGSLRDYVADHDALGRDNTSRLSPYLRFGCVSPRELESLLPHGEGPDAFRRQLCWRDFYAQLLLHHPGNAEAEFRERYRDAIDWADDDDGFAAWCDGRTGFPLVDAGMRQLRREGWMHNRAQPMPSAPRAARSDATTRSRSSITAPRASGRWTATASRRAPGLRRRGGGLGLNGPYLTMEMIQLDDPLLGWLHCSPMATEIPQRMLRNDTAGLLRRVEDGERLRITVHGHAVADLVPVERATAFVPFDEAVRELRGLMLADDRFDAELRALDDVPGDVFE